MGGAGTTFTINTQYPLALSTLQYHTLSTRLINTQPINTLSIHSINPVTHHIYSTSPPIYLTLFFRYDGYWGAWPQHTLFILPPILFIQLTQPIHSTTNSI